MNFLWNSTLNVSLVINLFRTYHHHHVVLLARISLTLSRHFSLSFIASGRSSGLHPVSPHSCCMYVLAGRPAFARPYVGVHRNTSFMSSSLLLQQCLVRLTWIVFVMGGRWPYSWCFVGSWRQDLFNIARNILMKNAVKIAIDVWCFFSPVIPSNIHRYFMNLKPRRRLLRPKHSTSTFIINSSNFGLFCFFGFTSYCQIYFLISFLSC